MISTFIGDLAARRVAVSRVPGGHGLLPNRRRGADRAAGAENASAGAIATIVCARRRRLAFSNETDQDTTIVIIERIAYE